MKIYIHESIVKDLNILEEVLSYIDNKERQLNDIVITDMDNKIIVDPSNVEYILIDTERSEYKEFDETSLFIYYSKLMSAK